MSTKLHTFSEIFSTSIESDSEKLKVNQIVVPIIQRDYAQGRRTKEIDRLRDRFLDSLYDAVTKEPIVLDFVFGDINQDGILTPLDGQQRLTTLFLLYWYAARKGNVAKDACSFLERFSYETRYSAREFCKELCSFYPVFEETMSEEIVNESWFPLEWKKDPTINSMLVMLDSIAAKFGDVSDLWNKLENGAISFYFLPVKDMGLTDELYIKMNSRGKLLTQFEHFKAEFERSIRKYSIERTRKIVSKIDIAWTDMLWAYRGDDNVTDDEFLRYFKFVCDVICYIEGGTPQGRSYDEFVLLNEYFSSENNNIESHLDILEDFFDCWCEVSSVCSIEKYFDKFISPKKDDHEEGKIKLPSGDVDLFADCVNEYGEVTSGSGRFSLTKFVVLYAFVIYLLNRSNITEEQFRRRIRIVNNLCRNSVDELSDSEARASGNRMPAILKQVDSVIIRGYIDENIGPNFNAFQIEEEKDKLLWTNRHPDESEMLFRLEDHYMLHGQIGIIGLNNIDLTDRFCSLFKCDWNRIDCAMMAMGNYGQMEKNGWRYQYASSTKLYAWDELFHRSRNSGFENTGNVLVKLLQTNEVFDNKKLDEISNGFIAECEQAHLYPWRYYYIKYSEFRPGSFGKLAKYGSIQDKYLFAIMQTKSYISESTYMPYLKIADPEYVDPDERGQSLQYEDQYILCENDAFVVRDNDFEDGDDDLARIVINQNDDGIDTEDRVIKLKEYIEHNLEEYE